MLFLYFFPLHSFSSNCNCLDFSFFEIWCDKMKFILSAHWNEREMIKKYCVLSKNWKFENKSHKIEVRVRLTVFFMRNFLFEFYFFSAFLSFCFLIFHNSSFLYSFFTFWFFIIPVLLIFETIEFLFCPIWVTDSRGIHIILISDLPDYVSFIYVYFFLSLEKTNKKFSGKFFHTVVVFSQQLYYVFHRNLSVHNPVVCTKSIFCSPQS